MDRRTFIKAAVASVGGVLATNAQAEQKTKYEVIAEHLAPVYQYYAKDDESATQVLDMLCELCWGFQAADPNFNLGEFARIVAGKDSNIEWIITGDEDTNTDDPEVKARLLP